MTKVEKRKRIRDCVHSSSSNNNVPLVIDQLSDRNLRVAVYYRVAALAPDQVSSVELQTDRIKRQMERHPNWILAGIYKDEGCFENRKEMNRMLEDCKAGKIDFILTRSISQMSRNIDELLQIINTLKELDPPVGVIFETENIYTLDNSDWEKLEALQALIEKESLMKSYQYVERNISGRWNGILMTPEAKSLLGYKTAEKKDDDLK